MYEKNSILMSKLCELCNYANIAHTHRTYYALLSDMQNNRMRAYALYSMWRETLSMHCVVCTTKATEWMQMHSFRFVMCYFAPMCEYECLFASPSVRV